MYNEMQPPWQKHPDIPPGDLGWRMGAGGGYLEEYVSWITSINQINRQAHLKRAVPIPNGWQELVCNLYAYPSDDEEDLQAAWDLFFESEH